MAKLDVSMTPQEIEAYLAEERTVRLATVDETGAPHVVPLWFVWRDGEMWVNSTMGNVTVDNLLTTGRATGVVDDGEAYDRLRGVTVSGSVERVGAEAPDEVERRWSEKYLGGGALPYRRWKDRSWFVLRPERTASWDFAKIPEARARRAREREGA